MKFLMMLLMVSGFARIAHAVDMDVDFYEPNSGVKHERPSSETYEGAIENAEWDQRHLKVEWVSIREGGAQTTFATAKLSDGSSHQYVLHQNCSMAGCAYWAERRAPTEHEEKAAVQMREDRAKYAR